MNIRWGRVALATLIGIGTGAFELAKMGHELTHIEPPTTWVDFLFAGATLLVVVVITGELRRRFRVLRRPRVVEKLANFAFWTTGILAIGLVIYGLAQPSVVGMALTWGSCIPLALFGFLREHTGIKKEPDLFDWVRQKEERLERERELEEMKRRSIEYEKFLKENPDAAAIQKLPMQVRMRLGYD